MTVIAWDGHILAADRMGENGSTLSTVKKLWPLKKQGGAFAVCGSLSQGLALKRWVEGGMKEDKFPFVKEGESWTHLIVALPKKSVMLFENSPDAIEVLDSFAAWGIGREVALGALQMGASSIVAVEIASKWAAGCGRGCDWVYIETNKKGGK